MQRSYCVVLLLALAACDNRGGSGNPFAVAPDDPVDELVIIEDAFCWPRPCIGLPPPPPKPLPESCTGGAGDPGVCDAQ